MLCISVPTESSLCCSSRSSAFACVQGQDLKEGVVWEATLGGSNKTNALSDTYYMKFLIVLSKKAM